MSRSMKRGLPTCRCVIRDTSRRSLPTLHINISTKDSRFSPSIVRTSRPVQLSPERLQSIGVRMGRVEKKVVDDEIRVTGNVAVDETRLAYVQVRYSGYIQKVFADATY